MAMAYEAGAPPQAIMISQEESAFSGCLVVLSAWTISVFGFWRRGQEWVLIVYEFLKDGKMDNIKRFCFCSDSS